MTETLDPALSIFSLSFRLLFSTLYTLLSIPGWRPVLLHQVALLPSGQWKTAGDEEEKCKREVRSSLPSIPPEGSIDLTASQLLPMCFIIDTQSVVHGPMLVMRCIWKLLL